MVNARNMVYPLFSEQSVKDQLFRKKCFTLNLGKYYLNASGMRCRYPEIPFDLGGYYPMQFLITGDLYMDQQLILTYHDLWSLNHNAVGIATLIRNSHP